MMYGFRSSLFFSVYFFSALHCSWKKDIDISSALEHEAFVEKPIVVIVPSYNNKRWCRQNLDSIFSQNYQNFRVIYIDDASIDGTAELVHQYCNNHPAADRVMVVCNTERVGALANIYTAIHTCDDNEIVVLVDGDDWLPHSEVLSYINGAYQDDNVWITWGQFVEYPSKRKGFAADFPSHVVRDGTYRMHGMPVTHLRTFYAWLFKLIDKEDLLCNGVFYPMTWDKAMMAPMIEMAGGRYRFIDEILYVYNCINPINDCKVNGQLQVTLRDEIYAKRPYQRLESSIKKSSLLIR